MSTLAVVETVEHTVERIGKKEYPVTITRQIGLQSYVRNDGQTILVDAVTITDSGKLGVSRCITPHRDYTPEERAAGRKVIQDIIAKVMVEQGIW